jgi:hypothetical protein
VQSQRRQALLDYRAGSPLWLSPKFEAQAKIESAKREKTDPILHTLSSLYAEIWQSWELLHSAKDGKAECLSGDELMAQELPRGLVMTKLGAAVPFAMVSSDTIWVSSKHVFELVPVAQQNDGNRVTAVMRSLGWRTTWDRRCGGAQVRGYEHDIIVEAEGEVAPVDPVDEAMAELA